MYYTAKVQAIRNYFKEELLNLNFVIDKTGDKLIEMVGAQFVADEPSIFGTPNEKYIKREINWYNKQSLNINDFEGDPPKVWKTTANEHGDINSNYGWCIFSQENGAQYENVIKELKNNCESRRAIMIYTRPFMHYDYNFLDKNDFICTNAVQYFIRNDKLITHVSMRSNDAIYGYKNDFAWQQYIVAKVYSDLLETYPQLEIGDIIWNVSSLHVYERHFHLLAEISELTDQLQFEFDL